MTSDNEYYDDLETRSLDQREADLFGRLPQLIKYALDSTVGYGKAYGEVDVEAFDHRAALAKLPLIRKSELIGQQQQHPPFGGYNATGVVDLGHVFASPGPIYDPGGKSPDYWRMARALYAVGVRRGDLVYNTFSYHFTPAGAMLESGAHALGCPVFPAGTGQSELQVKTIDELRPTVYVGTPSFLNRLIAKAQELQCSLSSISRALVSGEALPPALRRQLESNGIITQQCYATADVGLIAYESQAQAGLIIDEQVIVEIVRPGTADPVADGEVGEVVVTTFNRDYPLIRFATGDLSAVMPGISDCGRTNIRLKGWMGRADQTVKVKGMFVHPQQVNEVIKRFAQIVKARLIINRDENFVDSMNLICEIDGNPGDDIKTTIETTLREVCKLRGEVNWTAIDSLANDGVVIEDQRPV